MNKNLIAILLFFIVTQSFAVLPPSLRCISVSSNGNISLNWVIPTNIASFDSYHIYRSNSLTGLYTKIDTIFNVNQTTYLDVGVNANNQSFFYYIQCRSTANIYTSSSDTIQSIRLMVINSGTGLANLTWNSIHSPTFPVTSSFYKIYKNNSVLASWTRVDSTQNLYYNDTVKICHDTVSYKIEVRDASNCYSISSIDGKLFEDYTAPITNGIDTVSVDRINGKTIIGWKPSPSLDTWGYIICHGSPCIALDTVYGRLNSSYIDLLNNPCLMTQTYRIAAFDSCFNTSLFSNNHTTIKLSGDLDICANKISLNWTSYINMNPTLQGYKIFMSKNGGSFNVISTNNATTLNYTFLNIEDSTTYCFYVQAFENTGQKTSSSCEKCFYVKKPLNPKYLYIRSVSVVSDNQIDVKVFTDPSVATSGYKIFKSKSPIGLFTYLTTIPYTASANYTYNDYAVTAKNTAYYYKVSNTDSCGNIGMSSNIAHTMLLTVTFVDGYVNKLEWTDYGDWVGNVSSYSVFRTINDGVNLLKLADVSPLIPGSLYQYLDDIQNLTESKGKFIYYIQANENPNATYNFVEKSNSNEIEIIQMPEMYIPNAFAPDGVNKEFKPVMSFVNSENYFMQIYNRFGQLIFENNNPDVGWNGTFKGEIVASGVYVYLIRYSKPNHDVIQKKGIITIVN
ncbi:MAG: gliding motility-associated C-terminal domain-containing protein [Bacteroidetes bacterium]|nr:gliding motility-associated C-terminal domain-containing protein [Bacteroidota bacterium]